MNKLPAFDKELLLDDGASSPYTANTISQVNGANASYDFGANFSQRGVVGLSMLVSALASTGTYQIVVEQSKDSFATTESQTTLTIDPTQFTKNKNYDLYFKLYANEIRLSLVIGGVNPSITVVQAGLTEYE